MVKIEKDSGVDIPAEFTSSIGSVNWPPEPTNNMRLKGVYPDVIESADQLTHFLKEFDWLAFNQTTRITARLVTPMMNIDCLPEIDLIETVIPLSDCEVDGLSDCALIYVGKNQPGRKSPADVLQTQKERAENIFSSPHPSAKPLPEGFYLRNMQIEERTQPQILLMYQELYSLFNWSDNEVRAMLLNRDSIIVAAFDKNNLLVSSALAESGIMNFARNSQHYRLSLVEITEAATLPGYRGNGLYQAVSDEILKSLAHSPFPPDLVFGELNLDAPGVLKVAARQERIPALLTARQFHRPHAWRLEQHVVISQGDSSQRRPDYPYNNLMVAFLPKKLLQEKYGK